MKVLYHGNCFDGCVSAALFSAFYKEKFGPVSGYHGLTHGPNGPLSEGLFDGEENAIVDFRYAESPNLTWWFDHHRSAFYSQEAREHFRDREGSQFVFDDKAPSCAGLMARSLSTEHGFDLSGFEDLIQWAERIDSASFADAEEAVTLPHPALKLMLFLEGNTEAELEVEVIQRLTSGDLNSVWESSAIQEAFKPIWHLHQESIRLIREKAQLRADGRLVAFDLTDTELHQYNKFIPYYLYPDAVYAVGLLSNSKRVKVGVGSSPWRQSERTHEISTLCERFGGGGHPAVGAVSLPVGAVQEGRQVMAEVIDSLS